MSKDKSFLKFEKDKNIYVVWNKRTGENLGILVFHRPWKKWVFEPEGETFYCSLCLLELVLFIEKINKRIKK